MVNLKPAKDITFFAKTNFRNEYKRFGIKTEDKRKHTCIVGKTGMGKTICWRQWQSLVFNPREPVSLYDLKKNPQT
ncbi:MAG: hypothetical protein DRH33_04250 [Candidatus Nealsonbacteria bacterium]|nr:MAG: hypothetical protein DRH33_04250 [Candidatus Nealsonbacteria bacterium]